MKRDLETLTSREHDLLIVGGGVIGAAIAWDAAQRGLATALVEGADFASGTSWNNMKTIHGGLRYLQKLDLRRTRQSIGDRRALLRIAPNLVRPLPFLIPLYGHGVFGPEALWLGLKLYDLVGCDRNIGIPQSHHIPSGRMLSRREVVARVPGIDARGLTGGAIWFDAQVSSAERLVLAFLDAAHGAGACLANYCEVSEIARAGRRVVGARVLDRESGVTVDIRARVVILATGPWTDSLLHKAGVRSARIPLLRATNVVLRRSVLDGPVVGARRAGRFLFVVPWRGRTIVGTEYAPHGPIPEEEIDCFVREAARAFPWAGITMDDVSLVHRGFVPGTRDASGLWSRDLILDHDRDGAPGLVSVVGVKYTTAREVAQRAVGRVYRILRRSVPACRTATTPLSNAALTALPLDEATRRAVREEMALRLTDVVLRRMDLGNAGPPSGDALDLVASTMARERKWSAERLDHERRALARRYANGFELQPPEYENGPPARQEE
ncbi:MAG: FAD-dependent oxidoreductase [Vicinamibacteria bacterium]|nr:FAD-dependent oxidoreductase [Vicinamibacteria bacterium]